MIDTSAQTSMVSPATIAAQTSALTRLRAQCAFAFLIGAGMVFMVGFAHSEVMHNAAHDTRHSLAFPCH
jgi:cobalt transporter subunit CbtB